MAEFLFTENDFTAYIETLDVSNTDIFKVLSSLQLLKPSLFRETIFLLINGRIDILDLTNISINNFTMQSLVDNILSLPVSVTERNIFYKDYLKNLPAFNSFMQDINLNYTSYLAYKGISATTFAKEVIIDPLRLITGSYTNLREVQVIYNANKTTYINNIANLNIVGAVTTFNYSETLETSDNVLYNVTYMPNTGSLVVYKNGILQLLNNNYALNTPTAIEFYLPNLPTDIISVIYSTNTNTLPTLNLIKTTAINEINLYKLIYTTLNINPLNIPHTCIIGWLMRNLFTFQRYHALGDNINWITQEMATDYNDDVPKNGIYTVKRLLLEYTWDRLDTATTIEGFLSLFSRIYFLRISILSIYGNTFFAQESINKELSIINDNIIPFLNDIKIQLDVFSTLLETTL